MNVGIYLGYIEEGMGGEYTFQESIVQTLETVDTRHRFFVFRLADDNRLEAGERVTRVFVRNEETRTERLQNRLAAFTGKMPLPSPLHRAVEAHRIGLIWYPSPQYVPLGVPTICTVLDLEHRKHPFFPEVGNDVSWAAAIRRYTEMIPRSAYVITGTEEGRQEILRFYHPDPERVRVIPFPVPPFALEAEGPSGDFRTTYDLRRPYLFYPAQFWAHKNHVALLHALELLRKRHALDMDVVFCGSDKGNLEHVKETARQLGLANNVRFLGFVPKEDLPGLYRNAFALVYPSLFGPDNLPPLEAFALGCPVVASKVAGAVEQLKEAALLVDARREEEIAAAVVRLHGEPGLKTVLVDRGRELIRGLTTGNYVRSILEICDEFEAYRRCWSSTKIPQ